MGRQRNASCSLGGNETRGSQPGWTEQPMETRPGVPQNGGNGLVFDRPRLKRDPVHREGSGVPQNGGNRPPMVETGVLFIGRGVAYRKTGLHGILFISTVDLLQPPPMTVHPWAPVHLASTARYSTGYCSTSPLHGLLFNHPSTGTPPPSTIHPALHHTTGSCSSSPNHLDQSGSCSSRGNTTGSCSSTPTGNCSSKPPQKRSLFIQRHHRSASVSSSSEGIARSGSVNSHRSIARVQ